MPIFQLLFDICLFRKGPGDVPHSPTLFFLILLGYVATGFVLLSTQPAAEFVPAQIGMEAAISLVVVRALLGAVRRPGRFLQSATAFMGTDALLSLFALPLFFAQSVEGLAALVHLPILGVMGWRIAVSGRIYSLALAKPLPLGVIVSILTTLLTAQIMALLFPMPLMDLAAEP